MEKKVIARLGDSETLFNLWGFKHALDTHGYVVVDFTEIEELLKAMEVVKLDVLMVHAYGDFYCAFIEENQTTLPPIVYWYIPSVDHVPQTQQLVLERFDSSRLPSDLCNVIDKLLELEAVP